MARIELCQFKTCTKPHDMPVRLRGKKIMLCRWHAKEAKELREREEQQKTRDRAFGILTETGKPAGEMPLILLTDSWR